MAGNHNRQSFVAGIHRMGILWMLRLPLSTGFVHSEPYPRRLHRRQCQCRSSAVEKAGADARFEDIATLLAAMTGEQPAALLSRVAQDQPQSTRPFVPTMLRQSPPGSFTLEGRGSKHPMVSTRELLQRLAGGACQRF